MNGRFDGETAIVTGSSKGIGKAIATALAREGANVVTNSRSDERAAAAAEGIREEVEDAATLAVECDVTDPASVSALVDAMIEEFGSLDVIVNNAGMAIVGSAEEIAPEDWQQVIDVDLSGVFYGSQAAGRRMIEQGTGGAIVNVSSMMGRMGLHGRAPYCAAKSGVDNLTRTLAVEWAEHAIHVNALAPGYIHTAITDQSMASAGYTTGEVLTANGGWTAFAWGSRGR